MRNLKLMDFVVFDGPCPFLLCTDGRPHKHPVCPDCGAVRFENLFCKRCRAERGIDLPGRVPSK